MVLGKKHNKTQQAKTIWKEPIKFKIRVSIYSSLSEKNGTLILVLHGKRRKKLHIMYFKS
jgi:hypothetical protein